MFIGNEAHTKEAHTMKNKIYTDALASWSSKPSQSVYVSTTDTAKLIRAALKSKFPGVKFSVRSKSYAGGSSIDVAWTDGPTGSLVETITKKFEGKGFDGMVDYAYYKGAWLYPDCTAGYKDSEGSTGTSGVVDGYNSQPEKDGAIPVSFSSDYVFTRRDYSEAASNRTLTAYAAKNNDDLSQAIEAGAVFVEVNKYGGIVFKNADAYTSKSYTSFGTNDRGNTALNQMRAGRMMVAA